MHLSPDHQLVAGLSGGVLIGVSASLFMYLTGKITGLSGITEGLVKIDGEDWHYTYITGLLASGFFLHEFFPVNYGLEESNLKVSMIVIGGLLSGFGTRLSGGCTSGHGLCGLGRFSPRSLTSVLIFMSTGMLTATLSNNPSLQSYLTTSDLSYDNTGGVGYLLPSLAVIGLGSLRIQYLKSTGKYKTKWHWSNLSMHIASFGCAFLFGLGLSIGGMCDFKRVVNFLNPLSSQGWDPTLAAVLSGGLLVTSTVFPYLHYNDHETVCTNVSLSKSLKIGKVPENLVIDWKLILGSICFGLGWGLTGLCPGPGIVTFGAIRRLASFYIPSLLAGIIAKDALMS